MWGRDDLPRMYGDLSWTWPLISPPEDYVEESGHFARAIEATARGEVRTLLHLGCGGGHNDHALKERFAVTGVDLSEGMLGNARRLNPELEYIPGDMRTVRLGRTFDAVALFDSACYMRTEEDLGAAFATAFAHCRPGGVFLTYAELTRERFVQNDTSQHSGSAGDVSVVMFENEFDPDPDDTTIEYATVYLIRRGVKLTVETDVHIMGLFPYSTWLRLLEGVGFEVEEWVLPEKREGVDREIPMFVCLRP